MHTNINRIVDVSLILGLCVAPYLLGGRYPIGRLAFVALAVAAAVGYAFYYARGSAVRWRSTAAQWLFVAAAVVVILQLVPLPPSLIEKAHPSLQEHLPLWTADSDSPATIGAWSRVSLYPHATMIGLAMVAAYAAIFLVAVQRLDSLRTVESLVRWVAVAAVVMAGVGLLQHLAGDGKFLGVYEHPFRDGSLSATGGFDNNNHFAHFLALGIGPLVWWLVQALRSDGKTARYFSWQAHATDRAGRHPLLRNPYIALVGLGVVLFAVLMSSSRGGALVTLLACSICGTALYRCRQIRGRVAAALAVVAVIAAVGVGVHGMDVVSENVADITSGSVEQLDKNGMRRAVWAANRTAFSENLPLGAGVGTHRYLIPIYLDRNYPTEFSHAESSYLQIFTETGVAGGIVLSCALALCGWWVWRTLCYAPSTQHLALSAAVVSSLAVSVVHSIWDFPWHIPALMTLTLLLAACLCRLASFTNDEQTDPDALPRHSPHTNRRDAANPLRWAAPAVVTAVGVWCIHTCLPPALASPSWDSYLRRSVALAAEQGSLTVQEELSEEERHVHHVMQVDAMIADLQNAIRHDPANVRFHLRLAVKFLARYDLALVDAPNEMPVNQLRAAADMGGFSNVAELHAWIERAVGSEAKSYLDRAISHIHLAHQQSPLEPEGYLHLADLAFLEGSPPEAAAAYLEQARRVDPHDGDVLIRAGADAFVRGEAEAASQLWRAAFATGPEYQRRMILLLAGNVPVGMFLQQFQPDVELLKLMEYRYTQIELPQELQTLRKYAAARTVAAAREAEKQNAPEAGELWLDAVVWYRKLDEHEASAACGRRAIAFRPQDFNTRRTVARAMAKAGDYAAAEEHFQWCVDHHPGDSHLWDELQDAMKGRMRAASAEAAGRTAYERE